ncbi:MarR family winged helix-turn-helix transcriptional regulator [Paenibacillus tundrae]|uniref:MarR family winged helix-turn-helix transcriptional regulator n=1 Tax=Paenibacillus tundrae TaxID=528187 RepID=UPI0030D3E664
MNENVILSLVGRIHRHGNRFIESELRKRSINDIAPSHGDILFRLYQQDSLTMQELSKLIDRDKSTVTVLVDKLVKRGYIHKEKDLKDTRIYRLSLTAKGHDLREEFEEISHHLIEKIYEKFSLDEKKTMMSLLQKIEF